MGLEHRPYIGSWRLGMQKVVQMTPDALVYLNGDVSLPGCPRCNGRIPLQEYLTEVSVDAGTDPSSASASFTLSIPTHSSAPFARDAQYILRLGLEVHVYERGYFPVSGLYTNLDQPQTVTTPKPLTTQEAVASYDFSNTPVEAPASMPVPKVQEALTRAARNRGWNSDQIHNANIIVQQGKAAGYPDATLLGMVVNAQAESEMKADALSPNGDMGLFQLNIGGAGAPIAGFENGKTAGTAQQAKDEPNKYWNAFDPIKNTERILIAAKGYKTKEDTDVATATRRWCQKVERPKEDNSAWRVGLAQRMFGESAVSDEEVRYAKQQQFGRLPQQVVTQADLQESFYQETEYPLQDFPGGQDISNVLSYPYYLVFHGIVTNVSGNISAGTQTISVQCNSMLHFWQYQRVSTNASLFGARSVNSKNRVSIVGHNFTDMHPYEIMYKLHYDTAGAQAGVTWALQQKTNVDAMSAVANESFYSLQLRYWEERFQTRQIRLRMHGADGNLFNAAQAVFLGTTDSATLTNLLKNRFSYSVGKEQKILGQSLDLNLTSQGRLDSLVQTAPGYSEKDKSFQINMPEMISYVYDLGQIGQLAYFESTYESKMDIAQNVCQITGFEFYQDVDGDFVYKPPFYNLDTSESRVYRIEDIDIISLNLTEQEPQATYITGKNAAFMNFAGSGVENEWGIQGTYIDYRLVAQYGWRPADFETHYLNDKRAVFFAGVNRLDVMNVTMHSGSVTIPIRPELRPGYPVYFPSLDCYYYCHSFSHSFSVGGECTTSLQIVGRRAKFYAPGDPNKRGIEAIDLGNTRLPQRPLEVLDELGQPKLAGFPNVVMALDPTQLNPMYFLVGSDIDNITSEESLQSLIKMAVDLKVLSPDPSQKGVYTMSLGPTQSIQIYFASEVYDPGNYVGKPKGAIDLRQAAQEYAKAEAKSLEDSKLRNEKLQKIQNEIFLKTQQLHAVDTQPPKKTTTKKTTTQKTTTTKTGA